MPRLTENPIFGPKAGATADHNACSTQSKEGATVEPTTDAMTDPKASSIHAERGAIVDTKTSATAEPKMVRFFLQLQPPATYFNKSSPLLVG